MLDVIHVRNPFGGEVRRFGLQLSIARGPFRLSSAEVKNGSSRRLVSFVPGGGNRFELHFGEVPWRPDETLELHCDHIGALPAVVQRVDLDAVRAEGFAWCVDLGAEISKLADAAADSPAEIEVAKRLFVDLDRETHHAGQHANHWTDPQSKQLLGSEAATRRQRFEAITALPALLIQSLRTRTYLDAPPAAVAVTAEQWRMLRSIGELHYHLISSHFRPLDASIPAVGRAFVLFAARRLVRQSPAESALDPLYLNGEPDSANFLLFAELFNLLANDPEPATPVAFWKGLAPYLVAAEAAFGHVYEPRAPYRKDLYGYAYDRFDEKRSEELYEHLEALIHGMLELDPAQLARRQRDLRRTILYEMYGHLPGVQRSPAEFWEYVIPSLPPRSPGADPAAAIRALRWKPVAVGP